MKNLVLYNNSIDERAAKYLADFLQCPCMFNFTDSKYDDAENLYGIGGGNFPYKAIVLKGSDRYATAQAVLNYINK
ncbi:hypothetical protein FDF74_08565 [Clostridium niameyense]|uniref:Uncharacterized protein n=1 Tax=Clostridium niameyense TaxID=1622073 RepID=A0A6M0RAG3_9CLOT|nr:hypothetical protein [Clostridium niameyense]NEZ47255.1 hypothetical protein [Clostridium niameyense]